MRLNKCIAHAGICSRRDADYIIGQGRVKVNGTVIDGPYIVQENDIVMVDDKPIPKKQETKVWTYYKPAGLITSHRDDQNRETVFDQENILKLGRVVSVGRLDLNSEGLLLLTNDPSFAHTAEKPSNKWERVYKVRVFGILDFKALEDLKNGITIDGIHYDSIQVDLPEEQTSRNEWIIMTLTEGKNREIRRVLNHLGLHVNRLIRLSYGKYELGNLMPGELRLENF
jgi:23S rRNA pseudouridine2605 synthase